MDTNGSTKCLIDDYQPDIQIQLPRRICNIPYIRRRIRHEATGGLMEAEYQR